MSIKRFNGQIDYFGLNGAAFACTSSQVSIATTDIAPVAGDGTLSTFQADVSGASLQADYTVKCGAAAEGGVALPLLLSVLIIADADLPAALATWKFYTSGWTLNTQAGTPPSFSASATGLKEDCAADAYVLANVVIKPYASAQLLFNVGTVTGGTIVTANYEMSGSAQTKPDGENAPVVLDIAEGMITASITINQTADATKPTFALGAGWKLQQPLTCNGAAGANTTWSMTAVLPLARA